MNEKNDGIITSEKNDLGEDTIQSEERKNMRKVKSVTNQWNILEDQMLGQAWIG